MLLLLTILIVVGDTLFGILQWQMMIRGVRHWTRSVDIESCGAKLSLRDSVLD